MNKKAIIVGAGSGIGRATAISFAHSGYDLCLGDINYENLDQTEKMLESEGVRVWSEKVDASDPVQVTSFMEGVLDGESLISTLVYAAGNGRFCPLPEIPAAQWDHEIKVNLSGAFYCAQPVIKKFIEQKKGGCLLFVSSIGATHNTNQVAPYCCSKAGLNMLVKCLCSELGNYRIRANAVMPGVTETGMTKPMLEIPRYQNMLKTTMPSGKWPQAEDIASLLLYLASDQASFINGQSIAVCGGQTSRQPIDWWPLDYSAEHERDWRTPLKNYPFIKDNESE